ncbi:NAD-dependent epimerase/dehydratase family protein [Paraglaciecola sp. L3A3]|uniref:NAD-dependent epimerase/dehydratase family protein n=1 Tax=Paraglaciecola sp. L3A3 TaxID=2686358 RepID=UPI00131E182E|nr:NAD-dependent epimerase/dehydratase family protein [Paraglaciecola sp. L3A3]
MSYLLVGGFGFIGKHLIEAIIDRQDSFTVVSRKDPDMKWTSYPYVLDNTLDDKSMSELAKNHSSVIYLASSSIPSTGSFLREITEGVEPAIQFIDRLTEFNPDLKVIYLSSGGQIYGNEYKELVTESEVCRPVSPYGYGKLMVEESLAYLHRTKGTKVAALRVANPVGRWQTGLRQGLVNVVFQALNSNKPVTIFGNGKECRDYIDADELAQLILLVANSDFSFKTWNVGSGQATSTLDLVSKIEKIVGKTAVKEFLPRRFVDPEFAVLDCSKLFSDLNWKVTKSIDEILIKTLAFKMDNKHRNDEENH